MQKKALHLAVGMSFYGRHMGNRKTCRSVSPHLAEGLVALSDIACLKDIVF